MLHFAAFHNMPTCSKTRARHFPNSDWECLVARASRPRSSGRRPELCPTWQGPQGWYEELVKNPCRNKRGVPLGKGDKCGNSRRGRRARAPKAAPLGGHLRTGEDLAASVGNTNTVLSDVKRERSYRTIFAVGTRKGRQGPSRCGSLHRILFSET